MDKPVKPEPKKAYSPPKMTIYGTVREITLSQGQVGQRDNPPRGPRFNRTNA
jgi:hypothetical protein